MGFPYHLSHHHVYELTGHQLQSASAVPFSIDGLLNGSCAASVGNSNPLLSSGCGMNGDNQHYKLTGKPCLHSPLLNNISSRNKDRAHKLRTNQTRRQTLSLRLPLHFHQQPNVELHQRLNVAPVSQQTQGNCPLLRASLLFTRTLQIPLKQADLKYIKRGHLQLQVCRILLDL